MEEPDGDEPAQPEPQGPPAALAPLAGHRPPPGRGPPASIAEAAKRRVAAKKTAPPKR